jgi:hypothetical protein
MNSIIQQNSQRMPRAFPVLPSTSQSRGSGDARTVALGGCHEFEINKDEGAQAAKFMNLELPKV